MLDAAKNALEGDDDGLKHRPGRISLFTLPGKRKKPAPTPTKERGLPLSTGGFVSVDDSGPTSKLGMIAPPPRSSGSTEKNPSTTLAVAPVKPKRSPEEEIALRKARRRLSKWLAIAVVVVVSAGLLSAGGVYLYRDYQTQQGHVAVLDDALLLVKEADETIEKLDEVVKNPFADGSDEQRVDIQAQLEDVEGKLQDADEKARTVSLELNGAREKEAANQTVAAIAARYTLVEQGQLLMNAATEAQLAAEQVDRAWKTVLKGDDLARQAAQLVTETTAENVEASKNKTKEALAAFDEAYQAFRTFNRRMRRLISRSTSIILANVRNRSVMPSRRTMRFWQRTRKKPRLRTMLTTSPMPKRRCLRNRFPKILRSSSTKPSQKPRRMLQRPIQQHVYKRAAQTLLLVIIWVRRANSVYLHYVCLVESSTKGKRVCRTY